MYNEVIALVEESNIVVDAYGDKLSRFKTRQVFADLRSIGQSEFYQAESVGLKPEIKFVLPDFLEYKGEKSLLYTPFGGEQQSYTVLRTYRKNNELELVCKRGIDE